LVPPQSQPMTLTQLKPQIPPQQQKTPEIEDFESLLMDLKQKIIQIITQLQIITIPTTTTIIIITQINQNRKMNKKSKIF